MPERKRGSSVIWGVRRAKMLDSKVDELATVINGLTKRAEPYAGPRAALERDPDAVEAALDVLRVQHEELLVADEELRVQLEELRGMEQLVVSERARTEAIFYKAPDPYLVTDPLGIVLEANLAAGGLINMPERLMVGKPIATFVDGSDTETVRTMTSSASEGNTVEARLRIRPRQVGNSVSVAAIANAFNERASLFWRFRVEREDRRAEKAERAPDVLLEHERSARQQSERANDAKDRLIALVSHDLRGPLNSILGWSEVLRDSATDESTRVKAIATIERNARAQAALIEDLLDISRITAGKLKVDRAPVAIGPVVRRAIDSIKPAAKNRQIEIHFSSEEDILTVLGDGRRLGQVLANLLGNALKFTPPHGSIFVMVSSADDTISITVRDSGRGIEPEALRTVFDCFHQGDGNAPDGGLGLGLYISKELVTLHGGTLAASSEGKNCGSTFTVTLPLHIRTLPPLESAPAAFTPDPNRLEGLNVLVVDDDPDTRELVSLILQQAGAKTKLASGVSAALQTFDVFEPDVVLSDIRMEGADGDDFVRALRKSRHSNVPAIAMSCESSEPRMKRSLELGFDAYLVKPVDMETLVDAVADAAEVGRISDRPSTPSSE